MRRADGVCRICSRTVPEAREEYNAQRRTTYDSNHTCESCGKRGVRRASGVCMECFTTKPEYAAEWRARQLKYQRRYRTSEKGKATRLANRRRLAAKRRAERYLPFTSPTNP